MPFSAEEFLNSNYTETNATEYRMVNPGDYLGTIVDKPDGRDYEKIHAKSGVSRKLDDNGSEREIYWMFLKVPFELTAPHDSTAHGRIVSATIFLDVLQPDDSRVRAGTHKAGELDFGDDRNVALGKLREALGQNNPGEAWGPKMLAGKQAIVHVEHELNKSNGRVFPAVTRCARYEGVVPGQ